MPTPDYSSFAREFLASRLKRFEGDFERTRAHSFEQLNALANALRLNKSDPRVGLLEKTGVPGFAIARPTIIAYDLGTAPASSST